MKHSVYLEKLILSFCNIKDQNLSNLQDNLQICYKIILDDFSIIEDIYEELIKKENMSHIFFLIKILTYNYIHLNADKEDKYINYLASNLDNDIVNRFNNDKAFGIDLLISYLSMLNGCEFKKVNDSNYKDVLNFDLKCQEKEIIPLDKYVKDAFDKAVDVVLSSSIPEEDQSVLLSSLFFSGRIISPKESLDESVNIIHTYKNLLLRILYADLMTFLSSEYITIPYGFEEQFNNHLMNKDYSFDNIVYANNFIKCYLQIRDLNVNISDKYKKSLRKINPFYR